MGDIEERWFINFYYLFIWLYRVLFPLYSEEIFNSFVYKDTYIHISYRNLNIAILLCKYQDVYLFVWFTLNSYMVLL